MDDRDEEIEGILAQAEEKFAALIKAMTSAGKNLSQNDVEEDARKLLTEVKSKGKGSLSRNGLTATITQVGNLKLLIDSTEFLTSPS